MRLKERNKHANVTDWNNARIRQIASLEHLQDVWEDAYALWSNGFGYIWSTWNGLWFVLVKLASSKTIKSSMSYIARYRMIHCWMRGFLSCDCETLWLDWYTVFSCGMGILFSRNNLNKRWFIELDDKTQVRQKVHCIYAVFILMIYSITQHYCPQAL